VQLGDEHDRVHPGRHHLVLVVGGQLVGDPSVVGVDRPHQGEEEDHREDRDPGSGEELRDQHDHQDHGGEGQADGVDHP
jgi:hypothetical protein